jgi:hypothetical protein
MPRNFTASMLSQLGAANIRPVLFCQMNFTDGPVYMWSGIGPINWNGQTWLGIGNLGKISPIEDASEIKATNVTLTLSAIPQDLLMHVFGQVRQGYPVTLWFGCLGGNNNVIADPLQIFSGRMDAPTIDEGAQQATIALSVENRLIDLNRSRERRYTNQDQQIDFPSDLGFQYVQSIQDWNGVWGKAGPGGIALPTGVAAGGAGPVRNPNAGGGPGGGIGHGALQ